MVEKISVSRDEVIHFSWLDHTWVYIYYDNNELFKNKLFTRLLVALFKYGIKEVTGKPFDEITHEGSYIFIKYDTNEIIDILKKTCAWLLDGNMVVKEPDSEKGKFFIENIEIYRCFVQETLKILEEKKYKYYFQRVDGMN
ncbi:MAG: hypothetical protein IKT42_00610 [Clostridia bacterium]|nr:hypothetical protein [Clostridia bacterium]